MVTVPVEVTEEPEMVTVPIDGTDVEPVIAKTEPKVDIENEPIISKLETKTLMENEDEYAATNTEYEDEYVATETTLKPDINDENEVQTFMPTTKEDVSNKSDTINTTLESEILSVTEYVSLETTLKPDINDENEVQTIMPTTEQDVNAVLKSSNDLTTHENEMPRTTQDTVVNWLQETSEIENNFQDANIVPTPYIRTENLQWKK